MVHYFKLAIPDAISFLDDLIRIMVYIDRYAVVARYPESIFTDMVFVPVRYGNAFYAGRVKPDLPEVFFGFFQADAGAIDQDSGAFRPDSGTIPPATAPEYAYF
jgi:hypothetical protein